MLTRDIEKIICKGIKNSPETMEFLKGEALAIFEMCRLEWIAKQDSEEDIKDPELWCEFVNEAERKFEKYLFKWFENVSGQVSFETFHNKLPYSIVYIFSDLINLILDYANFYELSGPIMSEIDEEFRRKNLCESNI